MSGRKVRSPCPCPFPAIMPKQLNAHSLKKCNVVNSFKGLHNRKRTHLFIAITFIFPEEHHYTKPRSGAGPLLSSCLMQMRQAVCGLCNTGLSNRLLGSPLRDAVFCPPAPLCDPGLGVARCEAPYH